jgi:nucleotide-binding universal stress UspA family protein
MSEAEGTPSTGVTTITTKSPKSGRSVEFVRDLGANLAETVELFGESVVHSMATSQIEIRIQGAARTALDLGAENGAPGEKSLSEAEAVTAGLEYVPGVTRRGGGRPKADPIDKLAAAVKAGDLTAEQVMDLLKEKLAG